MDRDLDVVVFGATGFAGRLVAGHLAAHAPAEVRVGLAGRSREKLERVRDELGVAGWELVVADSSDAASLAALAAKTRVVATTVGPYWPDGLALVKACAAAGTDYADLTGEVLFVRASIDRHHAAAAASGARIVHSCGFDSIPSDLGMLALHAAAGGELEEATLVVTSVRGSFSGGTLASMKGQLAAVRGDPEHRRLVADPYALSPDRAAEPDLGSQRDLDHPVRDDTLGMWLGPFVMASFNTRVVRRSNALQDWAYGARLRYREVMGFGSGLDAPVKAAAVTAGLAALAGGLSFGPTRDLLDRFLPAPGEGPSEESRNRGHFRMEIHGRTAAGARHVARVAARGDPGYAATAVMLGESALCLARDRDRLPDRAGVLTPATALGEPLADRLRANGFTLEAT
ncbi:MAG TPA: saccharopine dehydrogenase NADP-binding domain-containing protein [Solirubrobacteraceae bacterium]